jgi:Arc/MetJ family transcription regulator
MPKAPRRAVDHALRPAPDQPLARGHLEHMRRHAKFESQNRSKNVTARAQVRYAQAKFPPYC